MTPFTFVGIISIGLLFNSILGASIEEHKPDTIEMVAAIFRHGDRSPISTYPNDPDNDYKLPGGPGAVSRKGALQHINLGQKLRARYNQLLPGDGEYTKDNMYVTSSYVERCLMIAQSLLAGFMPPLQNSHLLPIDWPPIAITTSPPEIDYMAPFIFVGITSIGLLFHSISGASIEEHTPDTIEMVAAIFRHGDRSPISTYPNDPHKDYKWPGGPGALSPKGALQPFNLGKKLRARYNQLLPEDGQYTKDNMYVTSSYNERCLMSAQSLLAGFMPPLQNKNLLPIGWQPIAITTSPPEIDYLLRQHSACKKYDSLLKNLREYPPEDIQKMIDEHKDLYRILNKYTGENMTTTLDINHLYDALLIEQMNGLKLPDWTENIFPKPLRTFAEREGVLLTETLYMKQVKGGPFITEVFRNMVKKRENILEPNRKIFLYSAHDTTLVNIMNSLNIVDQTTKLPDYASMLILELHTNPALHEDFEVKIFYYPNSEVPFPKEILIPKCGRPCPLTLFGELNKHLMFDNFDEICENNTPQLCN